MGLRGSLAANARNPHVAGLLVGASALVFTTAWLLVRSATAGFGGTGGEVAYFWMFFLVATPLNAYLVTRLAWRRWVAPHVALGTRRAVAVGLVIGVSSYVPLSIAFVGTPILADLVAGVPGSLAGLSPLSIPGLLGRVVSVAVLGLAIGLFMTAGIPVALSVGIALLLARLDCADTERETRGRETVDPAAHVRPPR